VLHGTAQGTQGNEGQNSGIQPLHEPDAKSGAHCSRDPRRYLPQTARRPNISASEQKILCKKLLYGLFRAQVMKKHNFKTGRNGLLILYLLKDFSAGICK
jgi:hypothetical protein